MIKTTADVVYENEPTAPVLAANGVRVLQFVHSNAGGGVEALAGVIADGLRADGVTVDTCYLYPDFTASPFQKLKGVVRAAAKIVSRRPDVLIAYQSTASVLVGILGTLVGCKTKIVHQTATPAEIHPFVRRLDKVLGHAGLYTINIANSATTESAFSGYPRRYRQTMRRIDHGLEAPSARRPLAEVLRSHAIPDHGLILLTTGRLCHQKAQDRAIRALPLVADARLVIAGGGPDADMLRAVALECGVVDRVHLLGVLTRDQIADLLGAADVFVFPTRWETFGLAAVEAAMSGVAIVANDIPILREVLTVGGNDPVSFVTAEDPVAVAAGIERQRRPGQERRTHYRDAMRAKYSLEQMLGAYRALLAAKS